MKLDKKYIAIGTGVIAVGVVIYFFLKDRASRRPIGIIDDESVDFDFNNANGTMVNAGVSKGVRLPVNEYKKSVEQSTKDKNFLKYKGKKMYTFQDNVNVRMGAGVNNGFVNNLAGTIPRKKSFIGKVVDVKMGEDKKLWFGVSEQTGNQLYEIKKHFSWNPVKKDETLRWFRSDVVIVNMNK
jgi:hypothetical protein